MNKKSVQDRPTVTPEGAPLATLIDGVRIRYAVTHADERGTLCEILSQAWGLHEAPISYVYQVTIRPHKIKGWVRHRLQADRSFVSQGTIKFVLYDDREGSPTRGMLNELHLSEHNRGIVVIPPGVWHALQNVGDSDALFVNLPTVPYNHADPDKYRLPLENELIPYRFKEGLGW